MTLAPATWRLSPFSHSAQASPPVRLLLIDFDPGPGHDPVEEFRSMGYDTVLVIGGDRALSAIDDGYYDIVILDTADRGSRGFETLHQIKARSDVPVIVVTDAGELEEIVAGFELGADDYVVKPVTERELGYRIQAILRRRSGPFRGVDRLEGPQGIVMRVRAHTLSVRGQPLELTAKEFGVLQLLLERRGEVVTPDDLSNEVWGYETFGSRNYVEAHLSRLRGKLDSVGVANAVETVRGKGYVIR